jgi:hypothetical protein
MAESIKINHESREAALVIREYGEVEVYMGLGKVVGHGQLLALGLAWALENEEWKTKLMRRARERLLEAIDEGKREVEMDDGQIIDG